MDPSPDRLRTFLAVAEAGSFTHAAGRLHTTQQAVSAGIRRLERDLGVALFDRTTRSVALTAAGRELVGRARAILRDLDAAVVAARRADRAAKGVLRVGAMAGAALELTEAIIAAFVAAMPQATIEHEQHLYDDPTGGLRLGTTDVAFVRAPLDTDGLELTPLLVDPLVVMVADNHALAARRSVRVGDLDPYPMTRPMSADETWNAYWAAGRSADTAIATAALEVVLELVATGRAVGIASAGQVRFYPRPGITAVRLVDVAPSVIAVATRRGESNAMATAFVRAAVETVAADPATVARIEAGWVTG